MAAMLKWLTIDETLSAFLIKEDALLSSIEDETIEVKAHDQNGGKVLLLSSTDLLANYVLRKRPNNKLKPAKSYLDMVIAAGVGVLATKAAGEFDKQKADSPERESKELEDSELTMARLIILEALQSYIREDGGSYKSLSAELGLSTSEIKFIKDYPQRGELYEDLGYKLQQLWTSLAQEHLGVTPLKLMSIMGLHSLSDLKKMKTDIRNLDTDVSSEAFLNLLDKIEDE